MTTSIADRLLTDTGLKAEQVSVADVDRRAVSVDQWPQSLVDYRNGKDWVRPDAVVSPENAEQVKQVVQFAIAHGLSIVPYGAGSGVVGGGWAERRSITLDMKRMRNVRSLDADQMIVDVEGGMNGIHLEQYLRQRGFTLGHYPSSIICSSAGGWLAGRSAGQFSSRYGKIEDMVLSLRAVDGHARLRTFSSEPHPGIGPDELQLIVGSEGTLGVILDGRLRVWPKPEAEYYWGFEVKGIRHGLQVMREVLQSGFAPNVMRLYDEFDSLVAKNKVVGAKKKKEGFGPELMSALKRRSLAAALTVPSLLRVAVDRLPEKCTLILGAEGPAAMAEATMEGMRELAVRIGAKDLGDGPGKAWYHGRYHVSYKQAPVFLLGGYVDTMEVSAPWSAVAKVYDAVRDAMYDHAFIMAHFSHAYLDGCALYFTFAARTDGDEREHYAETWRRALGAATSAGASVSHHHGAGVAKQDFLPAHHGALWPELQKLRSEWDPHGVFNREKWRL